ncbi:MAG: hypothetical protein WCV99_16295 [Sterolibacterium sp.]|jgi:hypothetical protein
MTEQFVSILISALVAFVVALLTHTFASMRDVSKQQREQRVAYLVSAFRSISKANNHPRLHEVADDVEQAISDIQLLGTPTQIALAKKVATDLGTMQTANLDALLISLRDSLRRELCEKPADGKLVWLRIGRGDTHENRQQTPRSDRSHQHGRKR